MPRKGPAPRRVVVNDPVYGAPIVTQLVNKILVDGKKSLAESIVYDALKGVEAKNGQDAVATLKKALDNVRPTLEVKSRRVGGSTYQVPVDIRSERRQALAGGLVALLAQGLALHNALRQGRGRGKFVCRKGAGVGRRRCECLGIQPDI